MADQGKWFKLHVDWDDDPHIDALSLENQVRWVKFGTYTKKHGTDGKLILVEPARALANKFRLGSFDEVLEVLKMFPNYDVGEKHKRDGDAVTSVIVTIKNWLKYQSDSSAERTARWRMRVTPKKRGEEKRRDKMRKEEKRTVFVRPTFLELDDFIKSEKLNIEAQRFLNHYEANGWRVGKNPMKDWKATARNWKPQGEFNATAHKPANAFVASSGESAKYDRT